MKEIEKNLLVKKKKVRAPKTPDTIFSHFDKCSARVDYSPGECSGSNTSEAERLQDKAVL